MSISPVGDDEGDSLGGGNIRVFTSKGSKINCKKQSFGVIWGDN